MNYKRNVLRIVGNTIISIVIMVLISGCKKDRDTSPKVKIYDSGFKEFLVSNSEINTNGDDEISVAEAEKYTGKIEYPIWEPTSLKSFINITELYIEGHSTPLDSELDLSNNVEITKLTCIKVELDFLDLSNNTKLTYLDCSNNKLSNLDLGDNQAITYLACRNNEISILDLSMLSGLAYLSCSKNRLTYLNMKNGNNVNIGEDEFFVYDNPELDCITVDEPNNPIFSGNSFAIDEGVEFSTNCP